LFLNVVNQLILFAAELTATGPAGQVSELASRRSGAALTVTTSGYGP
jgi:hypothetical protein